jgi:hypothetical protein
MCGPFLAVCSLGVLEFDVINRRQQCSKAALLVNAVIHAATVQRHLHGIIYSGAILCALVVRYRFLASSARWFISLCSCEGCRLSCIYPRFSTRLIGGIHARGSGCLM